MGHYLKTIYLVNLKWDRTIKQLADPHTAHNWEWYEELEKFLDKYLADKTKCDQCYAEFRVGEDGIKAKLRKQFYGSNR